MASPEVLDSSGMMDSSPSEELSAPQGWTKKLMPRKVGTPKRKDVVFISPEGEEFKTKKQLDKYLKAHPGGPPSTDFDWTTGETPRRSARLSGKGRLSSDSTEAEPTSKRSRRSLEERSPGSSTTPSKRGRKSQAQADDNDNKPAEDEIMQEAVNEQEEGTTVPSSAPAIEVEAPQKEEEEDAAVGTESSEVAAAEEGGNQLGSSEEPESEAAVKVIAEEPVLTSEVDVKETETPVEEEKVEKTEIEEAELGGPLAAEDVVAKVPEGETHEGDATQNNVDGNDNSEVNSTTKDEESLKPKDHVEPQGIHALIEEPVSCGDQ
ncbi:hypothetical protein R1sor_010380 [Riccia sorocarpa]|uniref:MBD domain-containing protein n=1 Tax=Riccia sorocarpa TaxID=122646 RepID=A0ABD3I3Y6_9MARC